MINGEANLPVSAAPLTPIARKAVAVLNREQAAARALCTRLKLDGEKVMIELRKMQLMAV
jgi:hypothetical protein